MLPTLTLLLSLMQSRRIEGRGSIKRADEFEYINPTYLPRDRTILAVNYYNRRKEELKTSLNHPNHRHPSPSPSLSQNHLQQTIRNAFQGSGSKAQASLLSKVKQIHVEPIINNASQITSFPFEKYPLQQHEKVEIAQERDFPLQNYYQFFYENQFKKKTVDFAHETQAKMMAVVGRKEGEGNMEEQVSQFHLQQNLKFINDPSKLTNMGSKGAKQHLSPRQLAPIHVDYPSNYRNNIFTVNQNTRMELSRRR